MIRLLEFADRHQWVVGVPFILGAYACALAFVLIVNSE